MVNIEERGRQASVDGFAHEHIAAGILMKRYQNVSLVDLPLSPYDIIRGVSLYLLEIFLSQFVWYKARTDVLLFTRT